MEILRAAPLENIIGMYPIYHEMDILKFVEQMNHLVKEASPQSRLREHRDNCGMSQAELAAEAGVPLRQIQLFEQGQRDINKTAAISSSDRSTCSSVNIAVSPIAQSWLITAAKG